MATITQKTHEKNLGFAFFGGPALWAVQLLVGYLFANLTSSAGFSKLWYYILSAVVVLAILVAGILALVAWRRLSPSKQRDISVFDEPVERREFVATAGLFLSSVFFWLTLVTGVFVLFISPARMITMPFP